MTFPFIIIEGLDGTGKTTLRKGLYRMWRGLEHHTPLCLLTTNYLDWTVGRQLVAGKYSPEPANRDDYLAALSADKRTTVERLIRPALAHRPVIADRWLVSEMTFFAIKHSRSPLETYQRLSAAIEVPATITFLLETDVEASMARAGGREGDAVRADWDVTDVQKRVKGVYQEILNDSVSYPLLGRVVSLDSTQDRATVLHAAWRHLAAHRSRPGAGEPTHVE